MTSQVEQMIDSMQFNCDRILIYLILVRGLLTVHARSRNTTARRSGKQTSKESTICDDTEECPTTASFTQTSLRPKTPKMVFESLVAKDYHNQEPPPIDGPTVVELGIYINNFYAISEQTMDFSLNIYLRQRWRDSRLAFKPFMYKGKLQDKMKLADCAWKQIWTPDVFFRNEKHADFHSVTTPNRLITLYEDGTVWYVAKITANLGCPMRLHKYPLDTQECPMEFESFGYTMDDIVYKWLPESVEFDPSLELPQFRLVNYVQKDCSQNYTTGAYPCLQIKFVLKRDIGFYMIQLYVPSVLIVILSWVAFWISIDAIPARVTIGLLTVLTMTTQSTGARSQLPRVSYIKAIDVWMSVCLLFVFASLLEFAVVNVYSRKEVRRTRRGEFRKRMGPTSFDEDEEIALEQMQLVNQNGRGCRPTHRRPNEIPNIPNYRAMQQCHNPESRQKARYIDKLSRKLFPLAFLTFNLIYWLSYILA